MGSRKQNFVEMIQDESSEQVRRFLRDNEIKTEDKNPKKKRKKRKP